MLRARVVDQPNRFVYYHAIKYCSSVSIRGQLNTRQRKMCARMLQYIFISDLCYCINDVRKPILLICCDQSRRAPAPQHCGYIKLNLKFPLGLCINIRRYMYKCTNHRQTRSSAARTPIVHLPGVAPSATITFGI